MASLHEQKALEAILAMLKSEGINPRNSEQARASIKETVLSKANTRIYNHWLAQQEA